MRRGGGRLVLAVGLAIGSAIAAAQPPAPAPFVAELRRLPAPDQSRGDPAAQAVALLATRPFRDAARPAQKESRLERWIKERWRAFSEWLSRLFGPGDGVPEVPGLAAAVRALLYLICGVAALVGLYFLVRWLRQLPRRPPRKAKIPAPDDDNPLAEEIPDALAAAHVRASEGDFRAAVRLAYLAALRRLRDRNLLFLEKSRTNWEYQRALRTVAPREYDALLPATQLFDALWYGEHAATLAEWEAVLAAYEAVDGVEPPA